MALLSQPVANFHQRQVTLFINPSQYPGCMSLHSMAGAVTANGIGLNTAGALETLMPANGRCNRNIIFLRRSASRKAAFDSLNHTKA